MASFSMFSKLVLVEWIVFILLKNTAVQFFLSSIGFLEAATKQTDFGFISDNSGLIFCKY